MNKYGYFIYEDFPNEAVTDTTSYTAVIDVQNDVSNPEQFTRYAPRDFRQFASFEEDEFNLTKPKPIYLDGETDKIPLTDRVLSNNRGYMKDGGVTKSFIFEVSPNSLISGSGFTIKTFLSEYDLTIIVTDGDGTRSQTFEKTDDEFYSFPYNGLTNVKFSFDRITPYHFPNIYGYSYGTIRNIGEADFVDDPQIETYFNVTSEDIDYDTLDLTIRSDKNEFNPMPGQRITYSETEQEFFISERAFTEEGNVEISCYDSSAMLEEEFGGVYAVTGTISSWIGNTLQNENIPVTVESLLTNTSTFSGMIEPTTKRDASQMMLQGNAVALQRKNNEYIVFNIEKREAATTNPLTFTEANIVGIPRIEDGEPYAEYKFTKHFYNAVKTDEKSEVYRETIPVGVKTRINFGSPVQVSSLEYYYVSAVDQQGNETLTPITPSSSFEVTELNEFKCNIKQTYTQTIVIKGYTYEESEYVQDTVNSNVPTVFKKNVIEIPDCTVMVNMSDYTAFRNHLKKLYTMTRKITLNSLQNATAGDYVRVHYMQDRITEIDEYGWIIKKTDSLNGLYEYEVIC